MWIGFVWLGIGSMVVAIFKFVIKLSDYQCLCEDP
jgi:hypothetical protein